MYKHIIVITCSLILHTHQDIVLRDLKDEAYLGYEAKLRPPDHSSVSDLHQGSLRGELDRVKYLIEQKKLNPLQVDQNGDSALHFTAEGGHVDIMKYLIEQ